MSSDGVTATVATLRAAHDQLAAHPLDTLTHPELLSVLSELEALTRQLPVQSHRVLARLHREASPTTLGARSLRNVLTGQPLPPVLARVAAAQAAGSIGGEHVTVLRTFFDRLPIGVDLSTREHAETTLVRIAAGLGPENLRRAACPAPRHRNRSRATPAPTTTPTHNPSSPTQNPTTAPRPRSQHPRRGPLSGGVPGRIHLRRQAKYSLSWCAIS